MERRPYILAVVLVWLIADALASAAPRCGPAARVTGEPALVERVRFLLGERGVDGGAARDCDAVLVHVASFDTGVVATVTDPDGRTAVRRADDVDGAATVIESWARRDVADPLLAARAGAPRPGPAVAAAAHGTIEDGSRPIAVGVAGELAVSTDGALWTGGRAHGCVRVGATCVGALVRYARDLGRGGDGDVLATSRSRLDLLLSLARPLRAGRLTITPGLAAGQTSLAVRRTATGQEDSERTNGLHLGASVDVSVRLGGTWSIGLGLTGGVAPFLATRYGGAAEGDTDPPLAGMPRAHVGVGLGLVHGGL